MSKFVEVEMLNFRDMKRVIFLIAMMAFGVGSIYSANSVFCAQDGEGEIVPLPTFPPTPQPQSLTPVVTASCDMGELTVYFSEEVGFTTITVVSLETGDVWSQNCDGVGSATLSLLGAEFGEPCTLYIYTEYRGNFEAPFTVD